MAQIENSQPADRFKPIILITILNVNGLNPPIKTNCHDKTRDLTIWCLQETILNTYKDTKSKKIEKDMAISNKIRI